MYIPNGGLSGVSDAVSVLVDQYKQEFSITDEDINRNSGMLNNILLYIYDFEIKPNIDKYRDIESINGLFNIYISLCYFYDIKPNINTFLSWLNISKKVYKSLIDGNRNIYISDKGLFIYNIKEFSILYPKDKYYILSDNNNSSIVSNICIRWKEVCESSIIDGIINTRGNPAGLIFVAKACYGYSETRFANEESEKIGSRSADQIASDYGSELIEKSAQLPPPADLG